MEFQFCHGDVDLRSTVWLIGDGGFGVKGKVLKDGRWQLEEGLGESRVQEVVVAGGMVGWWPAKAPAGL